MCYLASSCLQVFLHELGQRTLGGVRALRKMMDDAVPIFNRAVLAQLRLAVDA